MLFFVPSPTIEAPVREAVILGLETLFTVVLGYLLMPKAARRTRESAAR